MRTKSEQIAAIRTDQQFWRRLAVEVGPERYAEPGPMGEWSFGDLAGHLVGWRNRTLTRLEAFSRGEPDPPNPWPAELDDAATLDDDDSINAWIHAQHAGRSSPELVGRLDASYDRLVAILEGLSEAVLADPATTARFGTSLLDVDFGHHLHDEHVPGVRSWLDANR